MQIKTFNIYNHDNQAVQNAYEMLTANIYISNSENVMKTFVLTSCNPKEGKTSLAISLVIAIAHSGWKVLLVDADMRKPSAAKRLNQGTLIGLSDYLTDNMELEDALCATNIPNLTYLACGSDNTNQVGLLGSVRFDELMKKVRSDYDYVIFDTPALASVMDGALVASKADATIVVVNMGLTTFTSLKRVKEQFSISKVKVLGVVLNKVKKRDYKLYYEAYNYFFNSQRFLFYGKKRPFKLPMDGQALHQRNKDG